MMTMMMIMMMMITIKVSILANNLGNTCVEVCRPAAELPFLTKCIYWPCTGEPGLRSRQLLMNVSFHIDLYSLGSTCVVFNEYHNFSYVFYKKSSYQQITSFLLVINLKMTAFVIFRQLCTVTCAFCMAGQYEDGAVDRLRMAASSRIYSCAILKKVTISHCLSRHSYCAPCYRCFCGMFGLCLAHHQAETLLLK